MDIAPKYWKEWKGDGCAAAWTELAPHLFPNISTFEFWYNCTEPNKKYYVVTDYDIGRILMVNTEYETLCAEPLHENAKGNVLCLGLGFHYNLDRLLRNRLVKSVEIVENNKDIVKHYPVHEFVKVYGKPVTVHLSCVNEFDYEPQKYDLIWSDLTSFLIKSDKLKASLKKGGKLLVRQFTQPIPKRKI